MINKQQAIEKIQDIVDDCENPEECKCNEAFDLLKDLLVKEDINVNKVQDKPHGTGKDIAELVKQDIESRAQLGESRYGERLKANNGRDALLDAYQEVLDLAFYLRQEIEERNNKI